MRDVRGILEARARLAGCVRAFVAGKGFLEVDTPGVIAANAPEANIDALGVEGGQWVRTSPELAMKRLLAAGSGPIFQRGPCARKGERGRVHREEFWMLEWYRPGGDETDILEDAKGLMEALAAEFWGDAGKGPGGWDGRGASWETRTVAEAFPSATAYL